MRSKEEPKAVDGALVLERSPQRREIFVHYLLRSVFWNATRWVKNGYQKDQRDMMQTVNSPEQGQKQIRQIYEELWA
jgi:hypothetical protein